ncbi:Metal-dependent hydrolase, endonuclease/exonuclease/phosphatase family [Cyclobacterium lianum]|uniref:Metal-dependent hydrolase, endonuclease/exonuclease/phosphatase family n=1 Tax=Cyclobacterium lianum TaxID=388280 RepID=A0A1M7P4Q6_9BACT|nr:endonuclease/exonuclease/phosphatase family protein [Cyclobacterium lianum]SHN11534.1 Metal-dependent hydrolase, endonuclease/exonuclease/phosphatase family [Cyclobacterium lianum]
MRLIIIPIFFISVLLFFSVYISPENWDYSGLLSLLIPIFVLLNLFLVVLLLFGRIKLIFFPILALIIGWKFFVVTFQWNLPDTDTAGFSVLSYNVMLFNNTWGPNKEELILNSIQWVKENPADIKCFQEFYQDYTTPSRNAIKIIGNDGEYENAFLAVDGNPRKKSYGMAIFSRFPIINSGKVFDNKKNNGAMFADIIIQKDTIRIYNAHLESMNISASELDNLEGIRNQYRATIRKLKQGIQMRAAQTKILSEHIQNSPHPVILAGDFNDLPYSYTYFSLRKILENAFEKMGRGFGFTYNKVLFFLRIDNIFFTDALNILQFNTHREVDYSDHYPISAVFAFPEADR